MLNIAKKYHTGDTIIEVLFAVTVFSLVVVAGLSIMNQGTALAQRSLEVTLVRQQIDAQVDALRFLHNSFVETYHGDDPDSYVEGTPARVWTQIADYAVENASDFSAVGATGACPSTKPTNAFIINTNSATIANITLSTPPVYSQVRYDDAGVITSQEGMWIEAVRVAASATTPGYYDFHVRACWYASGQASPMTIGTIARLYEPGS